MEADLQNAYAVLQRGGVILYPTDTIWGLGCDATNASAVAKIAAIKQRVESKNLIVLIEDKNQLLKYVSEIPEVAWDLIENTEQPLTLIYDQAKGLAPNITGKDNSVGIRITTDEFCKKLIRKFGKPIVSTSANLSGEMAPALFSEIKDELKKQVDYIVLHRQNDAKKGQASTIIRIALNGEFKIIRK